ncbi:hypothetical protein N9J72_01355 [Candidatus Gracilibacteria bacterium]|nr:hypothetical protein [Candidatus Gracilibacteria bacterium]
MKRFLVALDILLFEREYTQRENNSCIEFELVGLDEKGRKIVIHLREEQTQGKDKVVYLISCY